MDGQTAAAARPSKEVKYGIRPVTRYELWRSEYSNEGDGMCSVHTDKVGEFGTEQDAIAVRNAFQPTQPVPTQD